MRQTDNQRGVSLAELTIIVGVLSVLTAVASPVIGDYVADARHVKASADVQTIASSFARFTADVAAARNMDGAWASALLLVGPGDAPTLAADAPSAWTAEVDGRRVARLEDHLIVNTPGYPARHQGYRLVAAGWRGAYLSNLSPDPWGHRYAINVGGPDTVVLSPGPNGIVDTGFEYGVMTPGGDDIVAVVGGV